MVFSTQRKKRYILGPYEKSEGKDVPLTPGRKMEKRCFFDPDTNIPTYKLLRAIQK
jgi:hypothetical protein